jgi:UDP-N-acetylmuramoyl-tripeptide--D-alanyl-D-alanine ligase
MELYNLFISCSSVSIDSRTIAPGSLFIALKGQNFDGNSYVYSALKDGAKYCISDRKEICDEEKIYYVNDCLEFLQHLALFHRRQFNIPVIGITGSNGKTSTKELIHCVLKQKYQVLCTSGNLNNHIGVPLTLLQMNAQHEIAIIEMGANKFGDIAELCQMARPTHGIITNIGKAHLEGFKNFEGVLKTKKELFNFISGNNSGIIIANSDDDIITNNLPSNCEVFTYGTNGTPSIKGEIISVNPEVALKYQTADYSSESIQTQLIGKYNFYNFLAAICIGKIFDVSYGDINRAISSYISKNNRSQVEKTDNNTLIVDCYNANPSSMLSALESFTMIQNQQKLAILGDMLELGSDSKIEHQKVIAYCKQQNIELYTVGSLFYEENEQGNRWESTQSLLEFLKDHPIKDKMILLKGSRGIALEKLMSSL